MLPTNSDIQCQSTAGRVLTAKIDSPADENGHYGSYMPVILMPFPSLCLEMYLKHYKDMSLKIVVKVAVRPCLCGGKP